MTDHEHVTPSEQAGDDRYWMGEALQRARSAADNGEVPVGAIVVCDGAIIGVGSNATETTGDATAHAEMIALRQASRARAAKRLTDCVV